MVRARNAASGLPSSTDEAIALDGLPGRPVLRVVHERPSRLSMQAWQLSALTMAVLVGVALFLRVWNLQLLGWVPDTYERLAMTRRLLAADFPLSSITPPGIAVILAPFFAVLPDTLSTMQAVTIGASVALIVLGYKAVLRLTGERWAATLLAVLLTVSPRFVYASRDAFYDGLVVLLLAACVFAVPLLRGRRLWAYAAYGCLMALLLNIRPTNAVVLPAVLLYRLDTLGALWPPRRWSRAVFSAEVAVVLGTIAALTVVSVVAGGWLGRASGAPVTLDQVAGNVGYYLGALVSGAFGALFLLPLAVLGALRLWRTNRGPVLASLVILAGWPIAYAPFPFHDARYMLPAHFFVYLLAAFGPLELRRLAASASRCVRSFELSYGALASFAVVGIFLAASLGIVSRWDVTAAESDEGLSRTFGPVLTALGGEPVVVTTVAQSLQGKTPDVGYVDLVEHWLAHGSDEASVAMLDDRVAGELAAGREVYYLYTHWERGDDFHGGSDDFQRFFDSIGSRFRVSEVYRSKAERLGRFPWVLYRVEAR